MRQLTILTILMIFICLTSCTAQEENYPTVPTEITQKIDAIFAEYEHPNTPGVAIGVIQNGKTIYQKGYGSANLEYNIPIDPKTTAFCIGSVSKQFTVFAIMLLAEKGKLTLEDNIHQHLPELPDYGTPITIRQLANHTSGMRSDLSLFSMIGLHPDDFLSRAMSRDITIRQKELNFRPGEEFSYSNGGYTLLAEIVERVSEKDFADFMWDEIFQPLGMNHTLIMDDPETIIKNRAYCYSFYNGQYRKDLMNFSMLGSTGVFTTMEDFGKWALNFSNPKVGNKAIFTEMETVAILNNGFKTEVALGQFIEDYNGLYEIQHSGGTASFRAHLSRFPEQDFSVMLVSNYGNVDPRGKSLEVADLFLAPYFKEKSTENIEKKSTKFKKLSTEKLAVLSGNYLHTKYFYTRNIVARNDSLFFARPESGEESILYPLSDHEFQLDSLTNQRIIFQTNGQTTTMHLLMDGIETDVWERYAEKDYSTETLKEFEGTFYSEELQTTYTLELHEGNLTIVHPKMYRITLNPIKQDGFMSNSWQFTYLEFERDADRKIIGFRISSSRTRNVLFEKQDCLR